MIKEMFDLPDLIDFNDYGNYDDYEEQLLEIYRRDLWNSNLHFNGLRVVPRVHKKFEWNGKTLDWTFAHFTSKGKLEENRDLDLRRCERIGWVKPIIENAHLDCVKVFVNERLDNKNKFKASIVLWCESINAKVVLTKRHTKNHGDHYVITTFYLVNQPHRIEKENQEYENFVKRNGKFGLNKK